MTTKIFIIYTFCIIQASGQTWFNGDRDRDKATNIEANYLVTKTPIKILQPPKIDSMQIKWDPIIGRWKITLTSKEPLEPIYKPCGFTFDGWSGYTISAGDRGGGSFLELFPNDYEHAIKLRDTLTIQLRLSPKNISTDDKKAEKTLQ